MANFNCRCSDFVCTAITYCDKVIKNGTRVLLNCFEIKNFNNKTHRFPLSIVQSDLHPCRQKEIIRIPRQNRGSYYSFLTNISA